MNIAKGISILRNIINQYSDDTSYTDEFLYELLAGARATLISREYNKFEKKSSFDISTFYMPMVVATSIDCECVRYGCKVLKSKFDIPRAILKRNKEAIQVYTLGGREIIPMTQLEYNSALLSPIKQNELGWEIKNKKLLLWNGNPITGSPKIIEIRMIPENIIELANIPKFDANCQLTGETCFDPYILDLPMKQELELAAFQMCLELLNIKAKFPRDYENNATSKLKDNG